MSAIYHKVEQRTAAWYALRLGRPTASNFHRIITPGGKLSTQADLYMRVLLAEQMLGKCEETPETEWMIRGQQLEDSAVEAYEFATRTETELGGFVTDASARYGCSPDRLVGSAGILEMKCLAPQTMIGYLLDPASLEHEKRCQVQGEMLVPEREWVDLVAYHPEMPIVIRRVRRDEPYIAKMRDAIVAFCDVMGNLREKLEREYGPFPEIKLDNPAIAEDGTADGLGVSDEDVTAIWAAARGEVLM